MNVKILRVVYYCLIALLLVYVVVIKFFQDSFDPETVRTFAFAGVIVLTCAIVVRVMIFFRK